MVEETGASLADLLELDVTEISEIRFENLPDGIYDFKCVNPEISEDTKDGVKIFKQTAKMEVLECIQCLKPGVDKESLVGKSYNHRQNIEPADAENGIGRIRALASDMGVDSTGKLGEVNERMRDHTFRAKIVNVKDKTDPSIEYSRLRFDKKAA